jgi:predicted nucleic acid-binding protein
LQTKEQAKDIIVKTIATFPVSEIGTLNVVTALVRYSRQISLFLLGEFTDCNGIANGFPFLYSEDRQHNQVIENKFKIINPFDLS